MPADFQPPTPAISCVEAPARLSSARPTHPECPPTPSPSPTRLPACRARRARTRDSPALLPPGRRCPIIAAAKLRRGLDGFLAKDRDRALFGLEPRG